MNQVSSFLYQHADTLGHWLLSSPPSDVLIFPSCQPLSSHVANSTLIMFSAYGLAIPISAMQLLLASTIFCLVFWVIRAWQPPIPKGLKSPPGPYGWPILGNMLLLGKSPHLALTRLSQRYGDVLEIRIGRTPVVVLSGLDTIWQALVRQGDDFKGRPDLYSYTLIADGQTITFNPDSGPVWATRRHLAQNALKSFSIASDPASSSSCYLEEHVSKESEYLINKFQELMASVGHFDPCRYVVVSVANVVCAMCFGQRYDHEDQELLNVVNLSNEFGEITASGNPADFFSILRYLPNPALKIFKDVTKKSYAFVQKMVKEHYRTFEKVQAGERQVGSEEQVGSGIRRSEITGAGWCLPALRGLYLGVLKPVAKGTPSMAWK